MQPILQKQLDFLVTLSQHRTPLLNDFFIFLNYFDTEYFIFLLIPIVWLGVSWKWGIRLFFLITISAFINYWLKAEIGLPRPFSHVPGLNLVKVGQDSFPSGAAQNSMLLGGLLIYAVRSRWAIITGVLYIAFIGFSRLYLGVHYPTDVLAGYVIGFALLMIFVYGHNPIERFLTRVNPYRSLIIALVIPTLIMIFYPREKTFLFMSCLMAGSIGIFCSLFYGLYLKSTKKISLIILRSLIGVIGTFLLNILMNQYLFKGLDQRILFAIDGFILTFWIALAASPLLKVLIPTSRWMNHTERI